MGSARLLSSLLLLCTFSHLIFAVPPLRSDLGPEEVFEGHGTKDSVNPLYRLPKTIVPISYDLEIRPLLDAGYGNIARFENPGKVTILVECKERTDTIVLHTLNTTIHVFNVTDASDGTFIPTVGEYQFNITEQTVTVKLGAPGLTATRKYEIYIEFVSPVAQNRFDGLYLSSYIDPATKEKKFLCATDLEADDARRIFPLFDEPAMKANWTVSILRTANYHSLANHEKNGEPVEVESGWWKDSYKEVIPMSSYLFAVAVSDFTNHSAHPSLFGGKPVTIWGPPSIMAEGGGVYSANMSALLMEFFEDLLESEYPLPKMDKISLPDFSSGAMENWGLNTYREGRLLYLEGISTIEDKVRMSNTISHELIHQWFGNLVTMEWWNDLWLNEGFATYFAALGVEVVFPDYAPIESLLVNSIQPAMQMDVSASTHPISPDPELIRNETDFSGMFSTIVYHKGASIIRMMNAFLRDDNMMIGLRKYLKDFEYGNAVQDDLFTVLNEVANATTLPESPAVTVNAIMNTWTKQSGFPVVTVTREANKIRFMQGKYDNPTDLNSTWWIPITYVLPGYINNPVIDTSTKLWLGTESDELNVTIPITDWVLVNPTQIGNYRVIYDDPVNYDSLRNQLNTDHTAIDIMSKSALLDDYFNIAFSRKYQPTVTLIHALDLTGFLSKEFHFVPWVTFLTNMAPSYRMLGRSSAFLDYRRYLLSLINPVLTDIKMDEQVNDTAGGQILLRTRLVEWACNLGDANCIAFARSEFTNWMQTGNPAANNNINPDLRTTLYCAAIANGGDAEWDFAIARYADTNETSSKYLPDVSRISLIRALGCAKQSYKLAKLLDIALDHQSFLLPEHRLTAIQAVAGNSAGVDLTFNFLRNHFDTLVRRFGYGIFTSSVSTLSNYLNTDLDRRDLQAFADSREELLPYKASIDTSIANIQKNIEWMTAHLSTLRTWLSAR